MTDGTMAAHVWRLHNELMRDMIGDLPEQEQRDVWGQIYAKRAEARRSVALAMVGTGADLQAGAVVLTIISKLDEQPIELAPRGWSE